MTSEHTTLLWFRDDLRVTDHPALTAARADGRVIGLWIREARDAAGLGPRPLGAAARWWAHESLAVLAAELDALGIPLLFAAGEAATIVPQLAADLGVDAVRWSRRYAPASRALDARIKADLGDAGFAVHSHRGSLLVEPWTQNTSGGGHYKVFTPFWKAAAGDDVGDVLPAPAAQEPAADRTFAVARACRGVTDLDGLGLRDGTGTGSGPTASAITPRWWADTIARHWTPGARAAADELAALGERIADYTDSRDVPADEEGTSHLSPRLRFGELSPRQLLTAAREAPDLTDEDRQAWIRQLYWREFAWHLAYHIPHIDTRPMREEFAHFPYEDDPEALAHWQAGTTGIDLVDAGMAQLWQTGWMHNRIRMVTASLLTKNLLLPWWLGEQWFWDTLVDADEANNPVSWQWVAGSGADAAPYFRVFNPVRQQERFDPDGTYVGRWLGRGPGGDPRVTPADPDDGRTGDAGDQADEDALFSDTAPIIDLRESRAAALAAYERMRNETAGRPR